MRPGPDNEARDASKMPRGPLGDARPDANDADERTGGGQPVETVENRPSVGVVKPEDYPAADRKSGDVSGS